MVKCKCGHRFKIHSEVGCLQKTDSGTCTCDLDMYEATRSHAAALLRKARAQRDAERKQKQIARRMANSNAEFATAWRKDAEQADAARLAALEVAEREHARAEAAQAQADELRAMLENVLLYAPTPDSGLSLYSVYRDKARRLLAAHKERATSAQAAEEAAKA